MASPACADVVDTVTVTHRAAIKFEILLRPDRSLQKERDDLSRGAYAMRCSMGYELVVVRTGKSFQGSVARSMRAGSRAMR